MTPPILAEVAPRILMSNGRKIPQLALGTYLGWGGTGPITSQDGELSNAICWAIDKGYRHFDTAAIYQTETEVGIGLKKKIQDGAVTREELFVTTKLWNDRHEKTQVVAALRESLGKLDLDYVDLYLMHWPMAYTPDQVVQDIDIMETWRGMEEAVSLGLTRSIGVSNFNQRQIERVMAESQIKPVVLQVEVSPTFTNEALVRFARGLSLVVMAYSPMGTLTTRSPGETATEITDTDKVLAPIAKKYQKTKHQIVLRYLVDRGTIPIPKSITLQHIQQNIEIFDFQLTQEELDLVSSLSSGKRIVEPTFWQAHPQYPFEKSDAAIENPF